MVKQKAYAKINLFLNVVNKRLDGFHDLEMVMVPLRLHDVLTFKNTESKKIVISSDKDIVDKPEDNIVYKVAQFLQEQFSIPYGVEINIKKNIPIAAGLAGGSADAAATLRGLNKLWNLKLSLDDLAKLSLDFGSDIPFCVYNKPAIAQGRGEKLTFIKTKFKPFVLLVNPNIPISTAKVFGQVKEEDIIEKNIKHMEEAIKLNDFSNVEKELFNSLEKQTFNLKEEVRELKNCLIDLGLDATLMSGSGSTVFSLHPNKKKLRTIEDQIIKDYYHVLTKVL